MFAEHSEVGVVLVDDGSKDSTLEVLHALAGKYPGAISVVALNQNGGKGEAVRQGLLSAIAAGAQVVGYADADFSTGPSELLRLLDVLNERHSSAVFGARLARLGSEIRRKRSRHYLG